MKNKEFWERKEAEEGKTVDGKGRPEEEEKGKV